MEKDIQKTKRQEEHFIKSYAHLHRYLPDRGYYVTIDNYSDPSARKHIATNPNIDHLSNPEPCSKGVFMKALRSAINKMSGPTEPDTLEIKALSPSDFSVHVRSEGVDVTFLAKYISGGYFDITVLGLVTSTGDSIYGFLYDMGLLDFLKSELVNICRENIHVDKDAMEEDESKAAKDRLDMIRDSYMM